ncbi:MAG: Dihydroorotate dehydrogenase B (NAD(+)), catalytic subunit, partial [Chlamydiae bacterium]|nr:Dihydroorotate dehydrogenase B (NAD(+)), catalytic subunit [Chlamydiota bacterium]
MMKEKKLPDHWPKNPPIYDITKSYLDNFNEGPFFSAAIPKRNLPPQEQWIDFLGFPVASRLGVPAGPLLNSRFVTFAARMGFDILTYKTIRSQPHPAHPAPNMVYVSVPEKLTARDEGRELLRITTPPSRIEEVAATNSFGIPSQDVDYVIADIAKAKETLADGQVMIVSFVGTPRPGEDYFQDFVKAALIARDGGAQILEADLSCPNISSSEGSLYKDPDSVYRLSKQIKEAIGPIPLVIKLGAIAEKSLLKKVMLAAVRAGVDAVCGINTLSMKVVEKDGSPALGENRLRAGLVGSPIRHAALQFTRDSAEIIREEKLG